jgi:hypothetical protein
MKNTLIFIYCFCCLTTFFACKKDNKPDGKNPYDDWKYDVPSDQDSLPTLDPESFAGVYASVFKPFCANSGCHDGNFEPDFRSLESTYKSLVNKSVIKLDEQGQTPFRVVPGSADNSMLMRRMLEDLNGNSGIMPLSVDPSSDWHQKKETYIAQVKAWIDAGAKDVMGNSPQPVDIPPRLAGFAVTPAAAAIPFSRQGGAFASVLVPFSTSNVDIWFAFEDPDLPALQLAHNKVRASIHLPSLDVAQSYDLIPVSGPSLLGLDNQTVTYTHRLTLPSSVLGNVGDVIWFRAYVQDASNPIVALPSAESIFRLKTYCSIKLQ